MIFHWFFYVFHNIAKVNLGLYLEGLGRLLGSTWRVLGASWAQLGLNLGALGANLGTTWALLGPTWMHFGLHGPSKASLGLLLEGLGRVLEAPRSCLGGPKRSQQLNLEAQSPPRSQFWRQRALSNAKLEELRI